jgi:glycosyltransferase involved in cell wall biosynthesis
MTKAPKFSIITTCKGRLDHLKQTLPSMLAQPDAEVIVVDFSCPQDTAGYVARTYPKATVVKVEGRDYFSNWEARNAGAAAARGEWLLFCDADVVLDETCTAWLSKSMRPGEFGKFRRLTRHVRQVSPLGGNSLQGFQVVERSAFDRLEGYDVRLLGYGAGGDTELRQRAVLEGHKTHFLSEDIVKSIIDHDDDMRQANIKEHWLVSYVRGSFYRRLKFVISLLRGRAPPDELCNQLLTASANAADQLLADPKSVDVTISIVKTPLPLAMAANFSEATIETLLTVRVNLRKR